MKNKNTTEKISRSIWVTLGSALLALLGFVSCCAFPALAALLAALGVGSEFFAVIKPLQPWLISFATLSFAFEFYKAYRPLPKNTECACSRTKVRVSLWLLLLTFGGLLIAGKVKSSPSETPRIQEQPTTVPTCSSCG